MEAQGLERSARGDLMYQMMRQGFSSPPQADGDPEEPGQLARDTTALPLSAIERDENARDELTQLASHTAFMPFTPEARDEILHRPGRAPTREELDAWERWTDAAGPEEGYRRLDVMYEAMRRGTSFPPQEDGDPEEPWY